MPNQHGCVLEINGIGMIITGASGSGKTSLMLGLMEHARLLDMPTMFICDDQTILSTDTKCLIASAPPTIAGQIELRGYGIIHMQNKDSTLLNLHLEMIDDEKIERLPNLRETTLEGITLPTLQVPKCHEAASIRIVFAWINAHSSIEH